MSRARPIFPALCAALLVLSTSCAVANRRAGVANLWRAPGGVVFEDGRSTSAEVLAALGPPSQLIALGERTVFYYLLENSSTDALFLIIYNQSDTDVDYDRAVFFFDAKGVLEQHAISAEALPFQNPKR